MSRYISIQALLFISAAIVTTYSFCPKPKLVSPSLSPTAHETTESMNIAEAYRIFNLRPDSLIDLKILTAKYKAMIDDPDRIRYPFEKLCRAFPILTGEWIRQTARRKLIEQLFETGSKR